MMSRSSIRILQLNCETTFLPNLKQIDWSRPQVNQIKQYLATFLTFWPHQMLKCTYLDSNDFLMINKNILLGDGDVNKWILKYSLPRDFSQACPLQESSELKILLSPLKERVHLGVELCQHGYASFDPVGCRSCWWQFNCHHEISWMSSGW